MAKLAVVCLAAAQYRAPAQPTIDQCLADCIVGRRKAGPLPLPLVIAGADAQTPGSFLKGEARVRVRIPSTSIVDLY
jgi:hypothetical protein